MRCGYHTFNKRSTMEVNVSPPLEQGLAIRTLVKDCKFARELSSKVRLGTSTDLQSTWIRLDNVVALQVAALCHLREKYSIHMKNPSCACNPKPCTKHPSVSRVPNTGDFFYRPFISGNSSSSFRRAATFILISS